MCSRGQLRTLPKLCHLHESRGPTTAHAGWPLEYRREAEVAREARGRVESAQQRSMEPTYHVQLSRTARARPRPRVSGWSENVPAAKLYAYTGMLCEVQLCGAQHEAEALCSRGQLGTLPKSCHLHEARGPTTAHAGWPLEYKGEAEVASEARGRVESASSIELAVGARSSPQRSLRLEAAPGSSAKCSEAKPKPKPLAKLTGGASTVSATKPAAHGPQCEA